MELYEKSGYLNFSEIMKIKSPFIFITGGRGIGKSFGCLKWLIENKKIFLYLRRKDEEAKLQANKTTSQLSPVARYLNVEETFSSIDKIHICDFSNGARCYISALSTFSNLRGIDLQECQYIIYDEFVPEIHARKIKEEGIAFSNVFETVNRNRELEGGVSVKAVLLSNSLNLDTDIFRTFNLIPIYEKMINEGKEVTIGETKTVIIPQRSPISNKKENTVLYKATSQEYSEMALQNKFIMNDFSLIKKEDIKAYRAHTQIGDITIMRHKTQRRYYVIVRRMKAPSVYNDTISGRQVFKRDTTTKFYWAYLDGKVLFDSFLAMSLFLKYYE